MPEASQNRSPLIPMDPGMPIVIAANAGLTDPNFRESLRQMHAQKYPLIQMVEALGLDDEMSPEVRAILEGLAPDVVDGIRKATLEMLDRGNYVMPLDCDVTSAQLEAGMDVSVRVAPEDGQDLIIVRPAATA